ncbi:MAG: adenylate/guanylate cyclase domain-containing protein [Rhodocyclaceae bacterium]|jgi:adenylate cyclase|nr:adenylate/guanylate cyclase domain-containing protein [Rhodocyclaceae bacterium]
MSAQPKGKAPYRPQGRRGVDALLAPLFALLVALGLPLLQSNAGFVTALDEALRDAGVRALASSQPEVRLTVVDIDEESLRRLGRWPWPRERLASLLESLRMDYGARGIGVDMVLPEAGEPGGDVRLAALGENGIVVLAHALDFVPRPAPVRQGVLARTPTESRGGMAATGWVANHEGLAGARCVGNIGFVPDGDGSLRRVPLLAQAGERGYASLSLAMLECGPRLRPLATDIPLGAWRIPYRRNVSAYTVVPAYRILEQSAPRSLIEGRWVLVGASALGLTDRVATPIHPALTGVIVHAEILTSLLDDQEGRARPIPGLKNWTLAWLGVSIGLLALGVPRLGVRGSLAATMGAMAAWIAIALAGLHWQFEVSPLAGLAGYGILLVVQLPQEWSRERRAARRLRQVFAHYVAPSVLDELLRQPSAISLEPVYRDITVMVADMEDYSGHTERSTLEEAGALTRDFLTCLTLPVMETGGTLDKYTGDGLVAFWGAPLDDQDHANHALDAAQRILAAVREMNAQRAQVSAPPLRARIGLASGRALVGDLGTAFRSTYTAVGDCINIASRLQEAAKGYPWDVLIGEATALAADRHSLVQADTIRIRGLRQTVTSYRLA